jgi:hypothetical protein
MPGRLVSYKLALGGIVVDKHKAFGQKRELLRGFGELTSLFCQLAFMHKKSPGRERALGVLARKRVFNVIFRVDV